MNLESSTTSMEGGGEQNGRGLRSVNLAVRILGTLSGLVWAGLGFLVWRVSQGMLEVYRDFGMPETWRQGVLRVLGAAWVLALVGLGSAGLVWAVWRLPLSRATWLTVGAVLLSWVAVALAIWFFFMLMSLPATTTVAV